jgi:DNA-binding SARP family transcriptional activator
VDLGSATYRQGDPDRAVTLLRESLAIAAKLNLREATAWATEQLGLIAAARGDRAEAVTLLRASLTVHHELGDRWRTGSVLDALAGLSTDARTGARLLAAAGRLRQEVDTPVPPCDVTDHDERVRAVAAALSRSELDRATAEGGTLTLEQAVAAAIEDSAAPVPVAPAILTAGTPSDLSVSALGRSRVRVGGRTLGTEDWTYAKPRELLYHLLTRPGSTKAEIGLALWPEASGTELRNSFHTCLKFLRRAVGNAARVRFAGGAYHVDPVGRLQYDVDEFRQAVAEARRHGGTPTAIGPLTDAAARYSGDFLGDVPVGAWAEPYRAELRREYEHVLRALGGLLARERRFLEAADVFTRLVDHDPLLEAGHRALMRCHAALGDRGRALQQYDRLVRLLDAQLGAPPAPETTELYTRLRGQRTAA